MAIVKMIPIKEGANRAAAAHLQNGIVYISNPEKTTDFMGKAMIYGVWCDPSNAFEQMKQTKESFGKTSGRQAYHIILSFKEGETDSQTVAEFAKDFVGRYLENQYEAVIAVHNNTSFPHAHIIFNSVNFIDGYKYHCGKDEVEKVIQPLVNRMCEEYQLSPVPVKDRDDNGKAVHYWNEYKDGPFVWTDMIRKDLDEVINETIMEDKSFFDFINKLKERGYEIKHGKYLAVRPKGMQRFRRLYQLGEEYSEAAIRERIHQKRRVPLKEDTKDMWVESVKRKESASAHTSNRRKQQNGVRKVYLLHIYEVTELKKQKYSKTWKYWKDIQKLEQLKKRYELLTEHRIETEEDIRKMITDCKREEEHLKSERRVLYRNKRKNPDNSDEYEKECQLLSQNIKEKKLLRTSLEQIEQDLTEQREQEQIKQTDVHADIREGGELEDGKESTRIL